MIRNTLPRSFSEVLGLLRDADFVIEEVPGETGMRVSKHGCAAIIHEVNGLVEPLRKQPGFLLGGEISRLVDRGNQKFLKTSKLEVPATADSLRAVHLFTEELQQAMGGVSLYNQSLGSVSDRYVYDRLEGRNSCAGGSQIPPWKRGILNR